VVRRDLGLHRLHYRLAAKPDIRSSDLPEGDFSDFIDVKDVVKRMCEGGGKA